MNKIIKSGLIALVLACVTMFVFFMFSASDSDETSFVSDDIVQFSFGWPLTAGSGSEGGIGGGLIDINYNKLNLVLDFSFFLFVYFALLNFRPVAKPKNRKKK